MINVLLIQLVMLTIWVTALTSDHQAHQVPRDLLTHPGENVMLNCSHRITSYNTILWYQQLEGDPALKLIGYVRFASPTMEMSGTDFNVSGDGRNDAFLHLHKLKLADAAAYFCAASYATGTGSQAYFGKGTKLTVLDAEVKAPNVTVFPPSKSEICDKSLHKERKSNKVTLVCVATGFYPDHVSVIWKVNGNDQADKDAVGKVGTDNNALRGEDKMYSITSRLRIPLKTWANPNTRITCTVKFYDGKTYLYPQHEIKGELVSGMTDPDQVMRSAQTAKFAYSMFIAKSCLFGLFIFIFVTKMSRKKMRSAKEEKW